MSQEIDPKSRVPCNWCGYQALAIKARYTSGNFYHEHCWEQRRQSDKKMPEIAAADGQEEL